MEKRKKLLLEAETDRPVSCVSSQPGLRVVRSYLRIKTTKKQTKKTKKKHAKLPLIIALPEAEEFKATLVYRVHCRPARATRKNPIYIFVVIDASVRCVRYLG